MKQYIMDAGRATSVGSTTRMPIILLNMYFRLLLVVIYGFRIHLKCVVFLVSYEDYLIKLVVIIC